MAVTVKMPTIAQMLKGIITPEGFEREVTTETWEWGKDKHKYKVLTLTNGDITIKIEFNSVEPEAYMLANGHVTFKAPDGGTRTFDRYGVEDSFYIDNPLKTAGYDIRTGDRVREGKRLGTVEQGAGYREFGVNRKDSWCDDVTIVWDDGEQMTRKSATWKKRGLEKHVDVIWDTNQTIKKFIEVKIPESLERIARSESVPSIPFSVTPERKSEVIKTLIGRKTYTFTPSGFGIGYQLTWKKCPYGGHRADTELEQFFKLTPIYINQIDCD